MGWYQNPYMCWTESIRQKQLMAKICTGNLSQGGMPRNSVDRITDRPDMTSAVYRGRKASTQQQQQQQYSTKWL